MSGIVDDLLRESELWGDAYDAAAAAGDVESMDEAMKHLRRISRRLADIASGAA